MLLDLFDGVARDLCKHTVRLNLPDHPDLRNATEFLLQQTGHAVGMFGTTPPEIGSQQSLKLSGDEAHLRCQLNALLAQEKEVMAQSRLEKDNRFASQDYVFRVAKGENVYSQFRCNPEGSSSERSGRVGNPGPVHVQKHAILVCKLCEHSNLLGLVDRSHLCRLRDRNDAGLGVMFIADAMVGMAHGLQRDLAVPLRQRNQSAAGMLLRRAAFVGIDVGVGAAQYRVEGASQGLQPENIRAGAVERKKNGNVRAEMFFELLDRRRCVGIGSVGHHVTLVSPCNRRENLGVHTGIVVAGEAASRMGKLLHSETM